MSTTTTSPTFLGLNVNAIPLPLIFVSSGGAELGQSSEAAQFVASSLHDSWTRKDWERGIQVSSLEDLTDFRVHTRNSIYEITVIDHEAGEILIRAGSFFPERTAARL